MQYDPRDKGIMSSTDLFFDLRTFCFYGLNYLGREIMSVDKEAIYKVGKSNIKLSLLQKLYTFPPEISFHFLQTPCSHLWMP